MRDRSEKGLSGGEKRYTRRDLVKLLGALGFTTAIKLPHALGAPGHEHLPIDEEDEHYFQRLLINQGGALDDFRSNPTLEQIGRVVRVLARTKTEWANELREQNEGLHAGADMLFNTQRQHVGNGTVVLVRHGGRTRHILVTAKHVAAKLSPPPGSRWAHNPNGRDVSVRELTPDEIKERRDRGQRSLPLSPREAGTDVSGEIGAVIGFDSDYHSLQRKIFPSRISPSVTSAYFRALDIDVSSARVAQAEDIRLIVLPPEESQPVPYGGLAAQGMSGGAWVYRPRDARGNMRRGVALGGIFLGMNWRKIDNVDYVVGHIADHTQVRETITLLLGPESQENDWKSQAFKSD